MTEPIEDNLRRYYGALARQQMPATLQERLLERRRRDLAPPRWVGFVVGIATAAVIFTIILVPLLARNQSGVTIDPGSAAAIEVRNHFTELVTTSSSTLTTDLTSAQRTCASTAPPARDLAACTTTVSRLTNDLTRLNATFDAASVPGGVALPMAQLVQALNSFASAQYADPSFSAGTVITDATTVQDDLEVLRQALIGAKLGG